MGNDIRENKIDIFHGLSNELPRNIKRRGIKSVVTIHDLIFLRFPQFYNKIDYLIYKYKFSAAAKIADRVIATSEQTKSDLITFFNINPVKIEVVYQGCDPGFYYKVSENTKRRIRIIYNLPENYILYVGTIEERKNLLQIIKARHEHAIKMPLVAIGRQTSYMDKINKYISENKIKDIVFPGQIALSDLPAIYQMSSVFVYPSSFEGFGIPILEALNSGIPVIAATGSCLEETGGLYSVYINPDNPDEIAGAIRRILSDDEFREKMINEGQRYALNFREDKSTRKIMDLYQKLC
jgi:glycosyltransferase involved in cell wall biosynthesis